MGRILIDFGMCEIKIKVRPMDHQDIWFVVTKSVQLGVFEFLHIVFE